VLVLAAGERLEYGDPKVLMQDPASHFSNLLQQLN
jgi:hypothetical protein